MRNKYKNKAIIVDLDNCIAISKTKVDLPKNNTREEWDKFHESCNYYNVDSMIPVTPIIDIIESYYNSHNFYKPLVLFVTSREDTDLIRLNTYRFLRKYVSLCSDVYNYNKKYKLLMREYNDYRPSSEVKRELLEKYLREYDIMFALDDDISNCKMYTENGITTLHVM